MRPGLDGFETGVARGRAQAIGVNAPAIDGVLALRSCGRRDDAAEAARFERVFHLAHRQPEELRVLKSLAGYDDVGAPVFDFPPAVGLAQDDVDILARGHVDAEIAPRFAFEKCTVGAIKILTPEIQDDERLAPSRAEVFLDERGHLIERARMHRRYSTGRARIAQSPAPRSASTGERTSTRG